MSYDVGGSYFRPRESADDNIIKSQQQQAKDKTELRVANQEVSQESYLNDLEQGLLRPLNQRLNAQRKDLKPKARQVNQTLGSKDRESDAMQTHGSNRTRDAAQRYQDNNPEFRKETLSALREYIKPDDDRDAIEKKLREFYPDLSLQDEALDFLAEVTDGNLRERILEVKDNLNQNFGREILAGKNMAREAREFSEKGIGTPTALKDMYREVTGNPKDAPTLFETLSRDFSYEKLKTVIDFFLKSLGADLRSKGPSIEPGELNQLVTQTRVMQAILGVYRFFRLRMKLVAKEFSHHSIALPKDLNFEEIAKAFMRTVNDRFPSDEKFRLVVAKLGVERSTIGSIILMSQMRDAIREVDGKRLYGRGSTDEKIVQNHKDELWKAVIGGLESLEDDYEEELEQQQEEFSQSNIDEEEGNREIDDFPKSPSSPPNQPPPRAKL